MAIGGQARACPDGQVQLVGGDGFRTIDGSLCLVEGGETYTVSYLANSSIDRDILLGALSGLPLSDPHLQVILASYPDIGKFLTVEA